MKYDVEILNKKLDSFLEMQVPFYDCIVMKDGEIVYRHSNGFTDVERGVRPSGKELYNIFSCSKLITCVAALQLLERGEFALEDRLSDYLPEFANMSVLTDDGIVPAKNPITIKHLFTMTSGLSYDVFTQNIKNCQKDTAGDCPTRTVMKYLAQDPLLFEPGTRWEYGLSHDVLAALIEVLSGTTFNDYLTKNVYAPLGMNSTTFDRSDFDLNRLTEQYRYDPETKRSVKWDKGNFLQIGRKYQSGGAGCISSVDDYIKFEEAVRVGDVILGKETTKLLYTNAITDEQAINYWCNEFYGYSLGQRCPKDDRRSDFGWDSASGLYNAIDMENGLSVFFATHVLGHVEYVKYRPEIILAVKDAFCKK